MPSAWLYACAQPPCPDMVSESHVAVVGVLINGPGPTLLVWDGLASIRLLQGAPT
jgi:hypothetical protein